MALKIWTDLTNWVDWFEIDDVVQRLSVVFYLVCLLGFTVNIQNGFEGTVSFVTATPPGCHSRKPRETVGDLASNSLASTKLPPR